MDLTARGRTMYTRLPDGELMPYKRWRRLREEHRDCCRGCPVRKRLEGAEQEAKAAG